MYCGPEESGVCMVRKIWRCTMDERDREDIYQHHINRFGFVDYPPTAYEMMHWTGQLVRILQIVIPLAAAAQLGRLEYRLELARAKLVPKNHMAFNLVSYDDKKEVEYLEALIKERLLVAKLLGTLTS
jgi:hypothetical protein